MTVVIVEPTYPDRREAPKEKMSYDEFLAWSDDKTFAEWVDGDVHIMSPVSRPHQEISLFLSRLLAEFTEANDIGQIFTAPFQMRLTTVARGREPDLLFVAKENEVRIQNTYLNGPADLAIEIISPESIMRDRGEKYAEYESEGVREYWLIDPATDRADFFVLSEDHRYERVRPDASGIYSSTVLDGLWLDINWLWSRPLPKLRDVIKAWELR
ncbi:MAG: Uma2 family endonuclease [Capsulimonas sp.]|uniref:Uma2 family endonuclease n=1 Tax=Capsulimonas sp. TaxID=2494211 RepID=UPI00326310F2